MTEKTGKLYLVGAGIGDPDNITVRAQKILAEADVVFAMPFVSNAFEECLKGKEVYNAGHGYFLPGPMNKARGDVEDRYRALIRNSVAEGKTVVVLDFGDPLLYGPQSGYLREFSDLNPEVVPGISSVVAASAAIGMDLSGNGNGNAVIVTGAVGTDGEWKERLSRLAATRSTLILLTMKMDVAEVIAVLREHYPENTPVAIVCHAGELAQQEVRRGTLDGIEAMAKELPWDWLLFVGDFMHT